MKKCFEMLIYVFFIIAFISEGQYAQGKSVHQLDQEKYGLGPIPGKFSANGEGIIPLDKTVTKNLSKAVFGYLPDWEYGANAHDNFRYDLLSHIACFDFTVSGNGAISNPAYWPWTDLINKAHENGVKVIMSVANFNAETIHEILTNATIRENFYSQVKVKIETYQLDGVNIDFEAMNSADEGNVLNSFMAGLKSYLGFYWPDKEVSIATPAVNWGNHWNFSGLAESCDYMFIMGYDFFGSWSDYSGPSAPLSGGSYNITNTVLSQYSAVTNSSPGKLILGVPYFGYHWTTNSGNAGSSVIDGIGSVRYRSAEPSSQIYGLQWSDKYQTPWYAWNNGTWNQVWYDNDSSLALKYDLADSKDLMGIGMWALGYDGTRQELWNLIDLRYGSGKIPAPQTPEDFVVNTVDNSTLAISYSIPQGATGFKIFMSTDGINFSDSVSVTKDSVHVEDLNSLTAYYFKVKAFNSSGSSGFTEVLSGIPVEDAKILVVNGFDRTSSTTNTRDYIRNYAPALLAEGKGFASASNEAVFRGFDINQFETVIWMLGDESTSDETFNQFEQEVVKDYLDNGGQLFVSGSEIGWDLYDKGSSNDRSFYNNYLMATYIDDAPNGQSKTYYTCEPVADEFLESVGDFDFDNGSHGTFDVDWPDAIKARNGASNISKFKGIGTSAGYSGIAFSGNFPNANKPGKLVYLSVPFETVYPQENRDALMSAVLNFFETAVSVKDEILISDEFILHQNYPNPFNPSTNISFTVNKQGEAELYIYNTLGQMVFQSSEFVGSGTHDFVWNSKDNSGNKVSSGAYIYTIKFVSNDGNVSVKSNKMILMK